jgi:hypothetical protein
METVESILEHHGIRGMKWGVRRSTSPGWVSTTNSNSSKKRRVAAAGFRVGHHLLKTPPKTKASDLRRPKAADGARLAKQILKTPPKTKVSLKNPKTPVKEHSDAKKAAAAKSKVIGRKNTKALSNEELQSLVKRMNLEQQFIRLQGDSKKKKVVKKGASLTAEILGGAAKQTAKNLAAEAMSQQMATLLKTKK